jgi:hypothetical protein
VSQQKAHSQVQQPSKSSMEYNLQTSTNPAVATRFAAVSSIRTVPGTGETFVSLCQLCYRGNGLRYAAAFTYNPKDFRRG